MQRRKLKRNLGPFLTRLDAVCDRNTLVPLTSLTSVDWDEVFVFPEGTSPKVFEQETGHPAIDWGVFGRFTPSDSLMVLQKDGEFVEIIQFLPAQIHGNREHPSFSYDTDVLVRMTPTDHGCYGELVPAPGYSLRGLGT